MEIAENEENNTTNPITCICVPISDGTGFKKEVYLKSIKHF